jgi:hypothetical protein
MDVSGARRVLKTGLADAYFGNVNAVLTRYTLNCFDDYERLEGEDLRVFLRIVRSLASPK